MKINSHRDEQINKAIQLRESGKKDEDIIKMFPGVEDEIFEIFSIINMMSKNSTKSAPPKIFPREVPINLPRQNKTESIIKQTDATSHRNYYDNSNNDPCNNKGRGIFNKLTLISNNMNKKTAAGMGIIVLLLIFAVGASIALNGKRISKINDSNIALENEIIDEKDSFEKDSAELDDLANDNSADEIGGSLTGIENEVEAASTMTTAEFELSEKELAYEIDSFSDDLDSNAGIEKDASLNTLTTDLGGI